MKQKNLPIYGLLTLNGITIFGNALTEIAIPWLILEISNSPALVAIVMSVKIIPIIFSTFFSAYIVDKFGSLRMSVLSDLVNSVSVLLIPLFYHVNMLNFTLLAVLVMFSTILDAPSRLAKDVILAKQLELGNHNNVRINAINSSIESTCDMLAPTFASLLIPIFGTVIALYFDAITFLLVTVGLVLLRKHLKNVEEVEPITIQPFSYFVEGLEYLKRDKSLLGILIVSSLVNMVITPLLQVYLPYTAKNTFGSVVSFGVLMTSFVVGTLVSKLFYALIGNRYTNQQIIFSGYALLTLTLLSISLVDSKVILFVQMFFIGLSIGFSAPIEVTQIQKTVPEKYFARTMTLFTSIRFLCVPIGFLCFGGLLESNYASWTPAVMAGFISFGLIGFVKLKY